MNKNNKDAQFEAMASYFKSMLNPVSTKTISDNLSEKLNLAQDAIEETSIVATAAVKPSVKTEEIVKKEESPNVQNVETEKDKTLASDAALETTLEETKTPKEDALEPKVKEEIQTFASSVQTEIRTEEKQNVSEVVAEKINPTEATKALEVDTEKKEISVNSFKEESDNSEKSSFETNYEGSSLYSEKDTTITSETGSIYSSGLRRERENFEPIPQQETKVEVNSAKPVYEPNKDTLNKLSRIISQVKPEVKTETEVVTITGPRRSAVALAEAKTKVEVKQATTTTTNVVTTVAPVQNVQKQVAPVAVWENIKTEDEFQALFFKVDKVTFAVPLVDLGSIENLTKVTPIFGKPNWFMGMMNVRDEKVSTVDFAKWAMPQIAVNPDDFKYLIELGSSLWGITCTELIGTENLRKDQVQWRTNEGKRPWLAGLVKDKMCALIHVTELVKLFKKGVNIEGN